MIFKFHTIARKRWIKSLNKGLGSIGYTFENELGKKPDSMYFPDYRYRNKNLVFMIRKQDIDKSFDLVYSYDYDNIFLNTH